MFGKITSHKISAAFIATLLLTTLSCSKKPNATISANDIDPLLAKLAPQGGLDISADIIDPEGDKIGQMTLTDGDNGILIRVDVSGLSQGWHGIHLHQIGDCSDGAAGFKASGGHINPDGNQHGLLNIAGFERADMENIYAGSDGRATAEIFNSYVRFHPSEAASAMVGPGGILNDEDGFALVIHQNPDDHLSQPIGGAGPRVACAAVK
ncbi:MAG: superoxide dismutase family protein [bacterium]